MTYPPQGQPGPYGQPSWGGYDPYGRQQPGYPTHPQTPYGQSDPHGQPYGGYDPYSQSPYGGHPAAYPQQPDYAPAANSWQPGGGPPPPQPPKKSNTGLIVSIVFAALVLVGGGVTATLLLTDDDIGTTAHAQPRTNSKRNDGTPGARPEGTQQRSRTASATEIRRATRLARSYAEALSGNSATALAAITCTQPSSREAKAFHTLAQRSDFQFELLGRPKITGDLAKGKMSARDGMLVYKLHRTESGWCADYNWQSLIDRG